MAIKASKGQLTTFCRVLAVLVVLAGLWSLAAMAQPGGREADAIPVDLAGAIARLDALLSPEDIEVLRSGSEEDMALYHHGLGTSLRNSWGLWGGSPLARWFNDRGIRHPDDMSAIILTSYWRHLNGRPIELESQIRYYQRYWQDHADPGLFTCPNTGTATRWTTQFSEPAENGWEVVHLVDCGDGEYWAHEHGRGWFPAPAELIARIKP